MLCGSPDKQLVVVVYHIPTVLSLITASRPSDRDPVEQPESSCDVSPSLSSDLVNGTLTNGNGPPLTQALSGEYQYQYQYQY